MDKVKTHVLDALKNFKFYQFDEQQLNAIIQKVTELGIINDYEQCFITHQEANNMILHIASELANSVPNKGSFPKPPKSPNHQ